MSTPPRLLCRELRATPGPVRLGREAAGHAHVLRLGAGDAVVLFDGVGAEADATVVALDASSIELESGAPRAAARAVRGTLVLVQAWPKSDKIDSIVRMATELGAGRIHVVSSANAVARPGEDRRDRRLGRLRRIAEEAARQSGRADVPALVDGGALLDCLAGAPADALRLLAHESATDRLLDLARPEAPPEVWVAIGPEGGFAPGEVAQAGRLGWLPVRLAPLVLRVETAAPVALALALGLVWGGGRQG